MIDGLKTFKNKETQEPVIEIANRSDFLLSKGPGFNNLPDILVKWKLKPDSA